jgi:hypothetical protein
MAKYYVADAFSIEAGLQIGFLMIVNEDGIDLKSVLKSTDFGFNLEVDHHLN